MLFSNLERITEGKTLQLSRDQEITSLITDSRKAVAADGAIFFAIGGSHHDGHDFIPALCELGVRQFVVERPVAPGKDSNVLLVDSSIRALQRMAAEHRSRLTTSVIAITGSNGKTIIKEWLFQLLTPDFVIAKNPASYNSQIGVPLSVWQMQPHHTLGIFEAGISTTGEMKYLEEVLKPTYGIFTNIGTAHDEGFKDSAEKIAEKLLLFRNTERLLYCKDHQAIDAAVRERGLPALTWGKSADADIRITEDAAGFRIRTRETEFAVALPFADQASVENCFHCIALLLQLGCSPETIRRRIPALRAVPMRLELKDGNNRCQIIDDSYNNDLAGLQVSLEFLANQKQKEKKRLILSDILQSGLPEEALARRIAALVSSAPLTSFIGIGPVLKKYSAFFPPGSLFFESTDEFLEQFDFSLLHDEVILIKGARIFAFEKIARRLQRKVHGTVMEIDLGALVHNLNYFKSRLRASTRIMAMVKAFAYGSGSNEIANVLQYHRVDYLGVAYADEGIDLRKNNISLPIMVMNPSEETFESLLGYQLEPEIYSFAMLEALIRFLRGRQCTVHIKIDTGMHRLGFQSRDMNTLAAILREHRNLRVASIFSHLAGADEQAHDTFSQEQGRRFRDMADELSATLPGRPLYHLLNSAGILRLPDLQFDMVRLGIGLYGIDPTAADTGHLKPVATLRTIISQIREIGGGESVGYGRRGRTDHPRTIATIAIGYADGFSRAFSNSTGKVLINGKEAPVIGNVCMDMTMVDITGIAAKEGDEVTIFGNGMPIEKVAESINTIPYEILTNTSDRVKRVFVAESI